MKISVKNVQHVHNNFDDNEQKPKVQLALIQITLKEISSGTSPKKEKLCKLYTQVYIGKRKTHMCNATSVQCWKKLLYWHLATPFMMATCWRRDLELLPPAPHRHFGGTVVFLLLYGKLRQLVRLVFLGCWNSVGTFWFQLDSFCTEAY